MRSQHAHGMQHATSCMHGAAAPRADTHTAVQIQLYCTPSSWRRREALLFSCACPSQLVNVSELIPKGAEPCLEQLEFALSTGHLAASFHRRTNLILELHYISRQLSAYEVMRERRGI